MGSFQDLRAWAGRKICLNAVRFTFARTTDTRDALLALQSLFAQPLCNRHLFWLLNALKQKNTLKQKNEPAKVCGRCTRIFTAAGMVTTEMLLYRNACDRQM